MIFGIIVIVVYVQPLHAPYAPLSFSPGQETFSCLNVIMAIREYLSFSLSVLSVCCWRLFASWRSQAKITENSRKRSMCVCACANATSATSAQLPSASKSIYFVVQMPDYVCPVVIVFFFVCIFTFMQRIWIGSCAILSSDWRPVCTAAIRPALPNISLFRHHFLNAHATVCLFM